MDKEKKNKVKGICGTLLFHALLLFLLSLPFMSLSYEDPPTRKGGGSIAMNLIKQDPLPPKEVTEEVHEESEAIENTDVITSEESDIKVTDDKDPIDLLIDPIDPVDPVDPVTLFDNKINPHADPDLDPFEYEAEFSFGFDHPGLGGINDGLDTINGQRKRSVPTKLDYPLGLGEGYIKVMVEVDSTGKIVKIDNNPISTLTFTKVESSKMQGLYNAIIDQCKYGAATGEDRANKKTLLKIDFIH